MLTSLKELFALLSKDQRRRLYWLQLLVVCMSLLEAASVLAFGPFMALVGNLDQLQGQGLVAEIFKASGIQNTNDFLILFGIGVLLLLTFSAIISMFTLWHLSIYGAKVGADLSNRLYHYYMDQPWLFHASSNSSELTNKIAQECQRITDSIINPFMQMNAKLVLVIVMAFSILLYNPWIAIIGTTVFSISYFFIYRMMRFIFEKNGREITQSQASRFKLMGEGFGGIKDTLLLGRQFLFTNSFTKASRIFARARGKNLALAQIPKYAIELIAFGAVIFLVIFLLVDSTGNLGSILAVLAVFSLAGLKLLPAFQQIYFSVSAIRGNLSAFDNLRDDLYASSNINIQTNEDNLTKRKNLVTKSDISLNNIIFNYPGIEKPTISELSLKIPANKVIGLVGTSGSGKSTAIDVLLGLISPSSGKLLIDGKPLSKKTLRSWQNNIGFVAQNIFLADASIRENIAFGLPLDSINDDFVKRAASMAHLDQFLKTLPKGLDTRVGERGVQLSGGQRQRVGIARALYHDPEVLVFDEATSALDGITESVIMGAIHDFSGSKTIVVVAHRLATVKRCDCIYLMDEGSIIDSGTYEELVKRNKKFKKMAELA